MFQTNPKNLKIIANTGIKARTLMLACGACAGLSLAVFITAFNVEAAEFVNNRTLFDETVWEGEWQVEDTLFSLRVVPQGSRFIVEPVSSLGLEWTSSNGVLNGNSGTINVEYQGVSAQVLIQLISDSSAIARSLSCQPDYHVVCTLVSNQQALFVKVQGQSPLTGSVD
jgi:hypothetical protein